MVLPVTNVNNVKVYTVSGGLGSKSIPDWLARKKKKALKKDFEYRTRVELIQDFEFPEASTRIKTTRDGKFAMATGLYKPQMRVFEFSEVSLKFERHMDSQNINFEILSDDWTKSVLLQDDRSIELHAQGGIHYRTRIPCFGYDLAYHSPTCDVLVSGASNEVHRLNLDQGRFMKPIVTDATSGINCVEINPAHQLFGFGCGDGTVELWDPRSRSRVGLLSQPKVPDSFGHDDIQISALAFRHDGLTMGLGTTTGHTLLYDLRTSVPYLVKDHQYGNPIKCIRFHGSGSDSGDVDSAGDKVVVADNTIVKIWDRNNGKHLTSIEPETNINDVCLVENSGLIFTAQEGIQMGAYYIPQLGPAPQWASFLENITEEMEENPNTAVYDDYKFVTRQELATLGLEHLMGTSVLKAYMHGFFVDLRLYEKAKLVANPFAYEEYKERAVREKIEKERSSRIRVAKKLPAVNKQLARSLQGESEKNTKKAQQGVNVLEDSRFKDMFENPDFEVDQRSKEYKLLHPSTKPARYVASDDEAEEQDEGTEPMDEDDSDSDRLQGDSDSDDDVLSKIRKERGLQVRSKSKAPASVGTKPKDTKPAKKKIQMRVGTEGGRMSRRNETHESFGKRLQSAEVKHKNTGHRVSRTALGGMEMSFTPKRSAGKNRRSK